MTPAEKNSRNQIYKKILNKNKSWLETITTMVYPEKILRLLDNFWKKKE